MNPAVRWRGDAVPQLLCLVCLVLSATPLCAVDAASMAVLYLENDEHSRALARHYAERRGIPASQVIGVDMPASAATVAVSRFERAFVALNKRLPSNVQALTLAWARPYRVACMSVTSAFAFGFDERFCARGCKPTAASPYFGAVSRDPYEDFGLRPTMMLNAGSRAATRALIDRGINSDGQRPPGTAYLVSTTDRARDTRASRFDLALRLLHKRTRVRRVLAGDHVRPTDALFYFTGTRRVADVADFGFRDGAIADHLTSAGGVLDGDRQMPATAWLAAGASGSFGTVVEPCNYPHKFPDPPVVMAHYLNGDTLIEAYWKSVRWPGQGLFLGEPLARPFAPAGNRAPKH